MRDIVLSVEQTKREIARIAYFDPRKLFTVDGRPLAITELDDDTAAAVAGLEVLKSESPDGSADGMILRWRLADKGAALEKAARIAGLYERDHQQGRPEVRFVIVPPKAAQ